MKKIKILLADDHKMLRDSLEHVLSEIEDFNIVGLASDGIEAIELTEKLNPQVLVMDINMPNMNGIEAADEIRKKGLDVKILILTMLDNVRFIIEGLAAGINGFLYKESDVKELSRAIRQVTTGEDYFNKEITKKIFDYHASKSLNHFKNFEKQNLPLTEREKEVVTLVSQGYTSEIIASKLCISPLTVIKHRKNILKKLNMKSFTEVIGYVITNKII